MSYDVFLSVLGFCPRARDIAPRDIVAAQNIARRASHTPRTGRAWARVLRSERRLFKRIAPLMGRGIVIGGVAGTR